MSPIDDWQSFLRAKQDHVSQYWLTRAEFESVIHEVLEHPQSPIRGLQFSLEFEKPFTPFDIGRASDGEPLSQRVTLNDNRKGSCRIRWWPKKAATRLANVRHEALGALFSAWWKPELRTPTAGLPDLKRDDSAIQIAETTIAELLERGECPAVLSCDLDDFGKVNKKLGEGVGDRVIKEFGALAETEIARFGVLLHNGGDELVILCPRGALSAIRAAYIVRQAVMNHDFQISPLSVGMSAGLAATDSPRRNAMFQELRTEAGHALREYAKKPFKGCARAEPVEEAFAAADWSLKDLAALFKSLVLSASFVPAPFGNVWLDALSAVVTEALSSGDLAKGTTTTKDFIAWMNPAEGITPMPSGEPPRFFPASFSTSAMATPITLAFAVVHGILTSPARAKAGTSITLRYSSNGKAAAVVCLPSGHTFWESNNAEELSEECQLPIPTFVEAVNSQVPLVPSRAVLIKIGHAPLPLPAHLFSEIIVVDDRPTRGGCLPDFWEVSIARLVASVYRNPNIIAVFVVGDTKNGAETVERLRNVTTWSQNAEEMASRLSVTTAMLNDAAKRLEGRIYFPEDHQALVNVLARELETAPAPQPLRETSSCPEPLLNRPLVLKDLALRNIDGCHVETVAQAFPVVLEIARKADVPLILDQAGQLLRELVDFKVHLNRPTHDMIPAYYMDQKKRMEDYYESAFLDEQRFFGKAFRVGGQLEKVLDHLTEVIERNEGAFATRRAILVAQSERDDTKEWSPLGLVSVRIIPRFTGQHCELSYSFTWRTVEALVGFPYSLYGSVRFGQELTQLVSSRIRGATEGRVSMGYVSYIAHSLHVFTDEFGQAIARRIVNDATG